jgi:hypothetical protein
MVRPVLQVHKDKIQARLEPSTAPHFVGGDKVTLDTKHLFLHGQRNMKLRDRQLGPFSVEERIKKHIYILKLLRTVRLHRGFHVNNLQPYSTTALRFVVQVTIAYGDDQELEVSQIFVVCIKSLHERRGRYLLVRTHFSEDDISPL